jgi:arginase family enzyme
MENFRDSTLQIVNHFINIPVGDSDAKGIIYNNFNFQTDPNLYNQFDDDIPRIYNTIYKFLLLQPQESRPITFSPDYAISSATIAAISEKYITKGSKGEQIQFTSPVKVIYLTSLSHFDQFIDTSQQNMSKSILHNLLALGNVTYTRHKFIPSPENILLLGLNDNVLCTDDIQTMENNNLRYFTLNQLRNKTLKNVMEYIKDFIDDCPIHVIFDMSVMSILYTPAVFRFIDQEKDLEKQVDGLDDKEIIYVFEELSKHKLVGLDITGYNLKMEMQEKQMMVTSYCAKLPLIHLLKLKQNKINVFTNDTKFLIFQPVDDPEIGWYILKGLTIELEDKLIKELELKGDNIKQFIFGDDNVFITTTTVSEQKAKSYYDATSMYDCVLIPAEEQQMIFYLMTKNYKDHNVETTEESISDQTNIKEKRSEEKKNKRNKIELNRRLISKKYKKDNLQ